MIDRIESLLLIYECTVNLPTMLDYNTSKLLEMYIIDILCRKALDDFPSKWRVEEINFSQNLSERVTW